jgi:hypothetical protein
MILVVTILLTLVLGFFVHDLRVDFIIRTARAAASSRRWTMICVSHGQLHAALEKKSGGEDGTKWGSHP